MDVNGNYIQTDRAYRVFTFSGRWFCKQLYEFIINSFIRSNPLTNNINAVAVSNLKVMDVSDYGNGRDVQVTFNKVSDESKVSQYRILVVKSAQADGFNLDRANNVSSFELYGCLKNRF
ncbi:hypothetical protein KHA80_12640 [Anaerobacillus sp. HL2]|nr:hypothetical protein KHA80_12640 [Anaerobacillus sp. HL2]